jgi:hypothetical protein
MREAWWYGSVFRRDPCLIEDGVRGESPSYKKIDFCRSGFSRDPAVSKTGGQVVGTVFAAAAHEIENEGSGRKPLLQKAHICRSGFRRDLARPHT